MDAVYQEQLLTLAKEARSHAPLEQWTHQATVTNPTCGDRVELRLHINDDQIVDSVSATVRGCALCEAGAGLLLRHIPNISQDRLGELAQSVGQWMQGDDATIAASEITDLKIFMPVRGIRNRHKCVLLSFEAAAAAQP